MPHEDLTYEWRIGSFQVMRGGFFVTVEKFWCDRDEEGWRWRGFSAADIAGHNTKLSEPIPLDDAKRAGDEWLDAQIAGARDRRAEGAEPESTVESANG